MKIVTHNKHKYLEYRERFDKYSIELEWENMEYPELQADSLEDIVKFSIEQIKNCMEAPFFIEDAGLFIDALNGFPGPYSSYVHKKIGNLGILRLMKDINNRSAVFCAVIGYFDGNGIKIFRGEVRGEITLKEKGNNGFGYDPIFRPLNSEKTFAEMDIDEKNIYSHRSSAFDKFIKHIKNVSDG